MRKSETPGASMTIWIDPDTKAEIVRLAKRIGISPSTFARNLVVVGLQESRAMEKVGVLQASIYLQHLKDRMDRRIEEEDRRMKDEIMKMSSA